MIDTKEDEQRPPRDSIDSDTQLIDHEEDHSVASESPIHVPQNISSRFDQPAPSAWKRIALLLFIAALFYVAFNMRRSLLDAKKQRVIYASRYSKEHRFRPAASPIITETLKDGRIRIRGGHPTPTPSAPPLVKKVKKRKGSRRKVRKAKFA